ncbi:putative signal transducing protein [Hasllibacter sp. MH4015]|uniref:putative signal transducing protein n=1 Tax=Hasllibacter sp. MH4015 TaxID=2854029 RepID=UPI001CD22A83|nr:DUF2007 domain-containing protein [Hasllibacter sp. MH4015]
MSRFKGFTRVAASFEPTEIRMAKTALEGAGFTVITPGMQTSETIPYASLALGPMEVLVPDADAEEAKALLQAIANGTVINHAPDGMWDDEDDTPEAAPTRKRGWLGNLLGFLLAGVSSPLRGLSVDKRKDRRRG